MSKSGLELKDLRRSKCKRRRSRQSKKMQRLGSKQDVNSCLSPTHLWPLCTLSPPTLNWWIIHQTGDFFTSLCFSISFSPCLSSSHLTSQQTNIYSAQNSSSPICGLFPSWSKVFILPLLSISLLTSCKHTNTALQLPVYKTLILSTL